MNQDKRARIVVAALKVGAVTAFATLVGALLYNVATAEKHGRERALAHEKEHGKKKQYIEH